MLVKWLELMETQVAYEPDGDIVSQRSQQTDTEMKEGGEEVKASEKESRLAQLRRHWKRYDPFEPSSFLDKAGQTGSQV